MVECWVKNYDGNYDFSHITDLKFAIKHCDNDYYYFIYN
jgi:hypothetical protein